MGGDPNKDDVDDGFTEAHPNPLEDHLEHLKGQGLLLISPGSLMAISQRCSALPDLDTRDADEILGYDEKGAFR